MSRASDAGIAVRDLSKGYGEGPVLDGLSFDLPSGETLSVIGPSGCGKSTLLYLLAGLDKPDRGTVSTGEVSRRDKGRISFILQDYGLFPWKTVQENLSLPLELQGVAPSTRRKAVADMLDELGLGGLGMRYPVQLSGGQRQRVAIARALATNPKVLLCDEATSALDPKTTRQILELIGDINKKLGITVVIITHQMSVVKSVCNHVAILDDGEVVEDGLVSTVFSAPKSAAARHLVFPGGADVTVSDPTQERRIRLIFRSAKTTSIPLVARLATEENIAANVISASTQKLSEEIYGSMLLGVPAAQFDRAWEFLSGIENLQVEEASVGVQ